MGMLDGFNAEDIKDDFAAIPSGFYTAMAVSYEEKTAKSGGEYVKLRFDIIDGQYKGRCIFHNLNLVNDNEVAVRIAKSDLANICRAVGILRPKSFSELLNKPMRVKVTVKPETDQFPAQNELKKFEALNPVAAPVAAPSTNGAAPWKKADPVVPVF